MQEDQERQQRGDKTFLLALVVVAAFAIMGAVICLNVVERRSPSRAESHGTVSALGRSAEVAATGQLEAGDPAEWIAFPGGSVLVRLPSWFVGGDLGEVQARAALTQALLMDPDEWFEGYAQSSLEQAGVESLMVGAPYGGGESIVVLTGSEKLGVDSSLESYAEEFAAWFTDRELTVESIDEDRAFCRIEYQREGEDAEMMVSRVALMRSGARVYSLSFTGPERWSALVDTIFTGSTASIVIDDQAQAKTGLWGQRTC